AREQRLRIRRNRIIQRREDQAGRGLRLSERRPAERESRCGEAAVLEQFAARRRHDGAPFERRFPVKQYTTRRGAERGPAPWARLEPRRYPVSCRGPR